MSKQQPEWILPTKGFDAGIMVNNSLKKDEKVPFVPANEGKTISWYICGPTVYDSSHLGHARSYLTFDIIKRILRDYFGYEIKVAMNITDIDDKIILRSNERGEDFASFSRRFELEFFEDMKSLGVELPDAITRISEYVPETISFIQGIIDNGYGYVSNESVYFDTISYAKDHPYGKLEPWSVGDPDLMAEGEGKLASSGEKKNKNDFVLWKKSKENEPTWESPWGMGRPGWHIECSAMACDVLGDNIDIHAGGVDLKFPHHDNEIAQSEARFKSKQWINYFFHAGHLHISGCKMSKSLKNFITIRASLEKNTARQIRMLYLMHHWDAQMEYSDAVLAAAVDVEKKFIEFFHSVRHALRQQDSEHRLHLETEDKKLLDLLTETKEKVHKALQDNFDTPTVLLVLQELVRASNTYMSDRTHPRCSLLINIARYLTRLFTVFGMDDLSGQDFGFSSNVNQEADVDPFVELAANFRRDVRESARKGDTKRILQLCDELRDVHFPTLGVRFEDQSDGSAKWKRDDPEVLKREMDIKRQAQEEREAQKLAAKKALEAREAERLSRSKKSPKEWFANQTEKYGSFDETGRPTHDAHGEPLSKGATKRVNKEWNVQEKMHAKYQASL